MLNWFLVSHCRSNMRKLLKIKFPGYYKSNFPKNITHWHIWAQELLVKLKFIWHWWRMSQLVLKMIIYPLCSCTFHTWIPLTDHLHHPGLATISQWSLFIHLYSFLTFLLKSKLVFQYSWYQRFNWFHPWAMPYNAFHKYDSMKFPMTSQMICADMYN